MKLPKYIQKKIEKQNKLVYEANRLQLEIEEWCTKVGIDIYSENFQNVYAQIEDGVGPLDKVELEKLYEVLK